MGAHAGAPHQRECTCCVVGGSVHFIVSCSIIARPRNSIPETIPFANILKWNARPRIRKRMLFVVIILMRIFHAFDSGKTNEIEPLHCEASQSVAEKRRNNRLEVQHTVGCPSILRHHRTQQYKGAPFVVTTRKRYLFSTEKTGMKDQGEKKINSRKKPSSFLGVFFQKAAVQKRTCFGRLSYGRMTPCPQQSQYSGLRRLIGSRMIMHDTMTSIRSIKCMATHKEKHVKQNRIIGFLAKLGHTWPILTLAHKTAKWSKQHGFQTSRMLSPLINYDTMASMNTKYGMVTYMTCPPS